MKKIKIDYVETKNGRQSTGSVVTSASNEAAAKTKFERDTRGEGKKVISVEPVKKP